MPTVSKAQFRKFKSICEGNMKPDKGMTRKEACEMVKGQSPKGLPERKSPKK